MKAEATWFQHFGPEQLEGWPCRELRVGKLWMTILERVGNLFSSSNFRSKGKSMPTLKGFYKPGLAKTFLNWKGTPIICPLSGSGVGKLFQQRPRE